LDLGIFKVINNVSGVHVHRNQRNQNVAFKRIELGIRNEFCKFDNLLILLIEVCVKGDNV
jgi:hypothetical protein